MNLVLLCSFLVGILCIGMGVPMALDKVPRNHLYGYRTPKTLSSAEIWSKANVYSGKAFIAGGAVTLLLSLLLLVAQRQHLLNAAAMSVACFLVQLIPVLVAVIFSALYVRRL